MLKYQKQCVLYVSMTTQQHSLIPVEDSRVASGKSWRFADAERILLQAMICVYLLVGVYLMQQAGEQALEALGHSICVTRAHCSKRLLGRPRVCSKDGQRSSSNSFVCNKEETSSKSGLPTI